MTFLAIIGFIVLLLIPFLPAILELIRARDALPLFIPKDYAKEPRYFSRSFKGIIKKSIQDISPGIREVKLSKVEKVEIANSLQIDKGERIDHILYIIGDMISGDKAKFDKEVYVTGDAFIGNMVTLRAIACEGRLKLSKAVRIIRWSDSDGGVEVSDDCDLGISLSSGGELKIGKGCKFKRLYGASIKTYTRGGDSADLPPNAKEISDSAWIVDKDYLTIPPLVRVEKDLIVKKGLRVGRRCIVEGSIKTYGDLIIESGVRIFGNLFSEEDIEIGEDSIVTGNIFSQGSITIKGKTTIGAPGEIKSVIGKTRIRLGPDIIIYGYVMTEGSGLIE